MNRENNPRSTLAELLSRHGELGAVSIASVLPPRRGIAARSGMPRPVVMKKDIPVDNISVPRAKQ